MAPPMLPVVSMAISMSAFRGSAGTVTVFFSVAVPPALTVKCALGGDTLARAAVLAMRSTIPVRSTSTEKTAKERENLSFITFPFSRVSKGYCSRKTALKCDHHPHKSP